MRRQKAVRSLYARLSATPDTATPVGLMEIALFADGSMRTTGANIEPEYVDAMVVGLHEAIDKLLKFQRDTRQRSSRPSAEIVVFPTL